MRGSQAGEKRENLIGGQSFDFAEHVISMTSLHANCTKAKEEKEKFIIYDVVNRVWILSS